MAIDLIKETFASKELGFLPNRGYLFSRFPPALLPGQHDGRRCRRVQLARVPLHSRHPDARRAGHLLPGLGHRPHAGEDGGVPDGGAEVFTI